MATTARIVSICQSGALLGSLEASRDAMMARLDHALTQKPDLVCLPETFTAAGVPRDDTLLERAAEPVTGPTIEAAAKRAKAGRCYVVCPIFTKRDGLVYNSAVIIDRDGQVSGIYDKFHPVTHTNDYTKLEFGVMPGRTPEVFQLDFGPVGIQICFDATFHEGWQALADQGAKLVLWTSAYIGGTALQAYAFHHHYYVASATQQDRAVIVNPCGQVLVWTDDMINLAVADINLDYVVSHLDFNYAIPDRIAEAYPGRVRVTCYRDEACFLVEPTDPAITTEALRKEFGFEPIQQYCDRHRVACEQLLAGRQPEPQGAAHGDRPQYRK